LRRRNLIEKDDLSLHDTRGHGLRRRDYHRALDLALEVAGYDDLRAEQVRRRTAGDVRQLGIGLSCYVEITNGLPDGEFGAVEVRPDGKVIVRTGTSRTVKGT